MNYYSPWQDAANGVNGLGQSLAGMAMGLAQLKHQQALEAQQQAWHGQQYQLEKDRLAATISMNDAHKPVYEAQAKKYSADAAIQQAALQAAQRLGEAAARRTPIDMTQGPTLAASAPADFAQQAAILAGLDKQAYRFLMPHNIGQNQVQMDPLSGQQTPGPVVLGQGAMYQMPGQQPIVNPKPFLHNIPANAIAVGPDGLTVNQGPINLPAGNLYQAPGGQPVLNPKPPGSQAGAVLSKNNALSALLNPMFESLPLPVQQQVHQTMTNNVPVIQAPQQTAPSQTPKGKGKQQYVKIDVDDATGKKYGQKPGTVGDKPEDWEEVQ